MPSYQSAEDELFCSRIEDLLLLADRRNMPRFTHFLDEHQQTLAKEIVARAGVETMFYGGGEDCERQMLGAFPSYLEPNEAEFPIVPLWFRYRTADELRHKDFLGSLMALCLKRESVGDILLAPGQALVFVEESVAGVVLQELSKIGRVGVTCERYGGEGFTAVRSFQEISGTVSSLRLDCLVALVTTLSRDKAAQAITSGLVTVNAIEATSHSMALKEGDKFTVRRQGKFILEQIGALSKKGRIHVVCKKYL